MIDFLQITFLSFIQGVTEFLPISSSAHLIVIPKLLHWRDQGLDIDIALHAGSLFAIIYYLRQDVSRIIVSFFALCSGRRDNLLAWHLCVATIPVVVIAALARDLIALYFRSPLLIASSSIVFGLLLLYADRFAQRKAFQEKKNQEEELAQNQPILTTKSALIIGIFQILALIPGTSRSGITITGARFLGINRIQAARFSMLLAIPVISLSAFSRLWEHFLQQIPAHENNIITAPIIESSFSWHHFLYAASASAIFSFASVFLFMNWLKRSGFMPFVIYRVLLGIALIFLFAF